MPLSMVLAFLRLDTRWNTSLNLYNKSSNILICSTLRCVWFIWASFLVLIGSWSQKLTWSLGVTQDPYYIRLHIRSSLNAPLLLMLERNNPLTDIHKGCSSNRFMTIPCSPLPKAVILSQGDSAPLPGCAVVTAAQRPVVLQCSDERMIQPKGSAVPPPC